ncbi:alanyl-tRNA editing protein [Oscillibacter sp. MSJ-2]|uniref:Alanyl-tRNA editing protein n=1 Tax=Dysosmobacter acutus TaxID=2841504 RepID=A0ABS6F8Y8_9FIRM|nr:alanine--tRNA ligase-related protein [Dysosmobacter acutus]MBU5625764.1 alanyl-tRNA editing protein [Dysosmobacter acutus]
METEKLYYSDPFLCRFTASVLSCEASKGGFAVTLDRTAFYPEGGGQPADHGILGTASVTDVHERDGVIVHTVGSPLPVGGSVEGAVDWECRFDHMQQHSGEHIISGILCGLYHCDNVGFHLGADTVTIDYNTDMTWEQVLEAERRANEVIWADEAVEIAYPSPKELSALDYRSKKELTGQVRIVSFPEADCCACCGTHVLRAGQVGLIKVLSCQKFRQGVRLEILCGRRALRYLSAVFEQNRAVAQATSAKPTETAAAVERLLGELSDAKARTAHLEESVFASLADQHRGAGDVVLWEEPMRPDAVRRLCDAVAQTCGGRCMVFSGEGERYAYAILSPGRDIREFVKSLNSALQGRGGGRDGFAQGSLAAGRKAIEAFLAQDALSRG